MYLPIKVLSYVLRNQLVAGSIPVCHQSILCSTAADGTSPTPSPHESYYHILLTYNLILEKV